MRTEVRTAKQATPCTRAFAFIGPASSPPLPSPRQATPRCEAGSVPQLSKVETDAVPSSLTDIESRKRTKALNTHQAARRRRRKYVRTFARMCVRPRLAPQAGGRAQQSGQLNVL